MAKLFYVINNVVNVINNVLYRKNTLFEDVFYANYLEFLQDFVINVMKNVIKLNRNGLY